MGRFIRFIIRAFKKGILVLIVAELLVTGCSLFGFFNTSIGQAIGHTSDKILTEGILTVANFVSYCKSGVDSFLVEDDSYEEVESETQD